MPKDAFKLPTGEMLPRIYGEKGPSQSTAYLNGIRTGKVKDDSPLADGYRGMIPWNKLVLATAVKREISDFDAVVSPPSSRNDADPYRDAILNGTRSRDISCNFTRIGKVKSNIPGTTLEMLLDEFIYTADGNESTIASLLIVDESISTGKSIAAVLHHLRAAGLENTCKVTIVTWTTMTPAR